MFCRSAAHDEMRQRRWHLDREDDDDKSVVEYASKIDDSIFSLLLLLSKSVATVGCYDICVSEMPKITTRSTKRIIQHNASSS